MSLRQQARRIFQRANRRYGQPYLLVVAPLAEWYLPAGFAYDDDVDAIRNGAGVVLPNPESYWVTDTVYIVPTATRKYDVMAEVFSMTPGGIVPSGTVDLFIEQADVEKVRVAHALQMDKRWYDVQAVQEAPAGYPGGTGLWARVTLRVRE